jgi:hypothetical protein
MKVDKRFEALVKQEMMEHQSIISSHHKEMQALRDALKISMERFDSLFEHSHTQIQQQATDFGSAIEKLQQKARSHETLFCDQTNTIVSLHADLQHLYEVYAQKADVDKVKSDLSAFLQQTTTNHLNTFQACEHDLKSIMNLFRIELASFRTELKERMDEQDKKVDSNFSVSRIDKDGVSKEIRSYQKSIFIIEKKIENIYTLIERINKRGEACHKPA